MDLSESNKGAAEKKQRGALLEIRGRKGKEGGWRFGIRNGSGVIWWGINRGERLGREE